MKTFVKDVKLDEIAKDYDASGCWDQLWDLNKGICNKAVEIDMDLLTTSQNIEKEAIILYGKTKLTIGIHQKILDIATLLNTCTI